MFKIIFSVSIFLICLAKSLFADTVCGDWQTYKDEKCFIIFDALLSYNDAINTCIQYNASLVTISSSEEQHYIETYLFPLYKIVENVWIGLRYTNSSNHIWINDFSSIYNYTNWSEGNPKNSSDYCVQIASDDGKWSDTSCTKRNLVMCQKLPTITMQLLLNMLINTRNKLETNIMQQNVTNRVSEDTSKRLSKTENELAVIKTQFDYFFSNKWIDFHTFLENNTRKAFIFPYKTQVSVLRSEALTICRQNNATLVDIESEEKQKLVESFLYKINPNAEINHYWLGGYIDPLDNYKYKWLNSGNEIKYTNWTPGYPTSNNPYTAFGMDIANHAYRKWWTPSTDSNQHQQNVFCEINFH